MPKAYAIFTEKINDQDGYNNYMGKAGATIGKYGAKPLVVTDAPEVLEGDWHGPRTIVLEFESAEAARAWYNSPEYQEIVGIRQASTDSKGIIVEGLDLPG